MNVLKENMKAIRYLPVEEFEKRFKKMYDSANDTEREEMIHLFEKGVDEHILKVDSFIEETMKLMKHDEMLEFA